MRLSTPISSIAALPLARTRWVRAVATGTVAAVAAVALAVGAVPGLEPQSASAGSVLLGESGEFLMTVAVNQDESELHPGGHVVYELTAFNPAPRDTVRPGPGGSNSVTPNYSLLLAYGMMTPNGLTPQSAEGFFSPGNFGVGGTFYGGSPRDFGVSELMDLDFTGLGENIATTGIRGQESLTGKLRFGIPTTAAVGSTYGAGVFIVIGSRGGGAYVREADGLESFTVLPIPTRTEVTVPTSPVRAGQPVELRAAVSNGHSTIPGIPEGTVTFTADGQTRTETVEDGVAATSMSFDTAGDKSVVATYAPSPGSPWTASSKSGQVSVEPAGTELELALSAGAVIDKPTTFTARVAPDAEGSVTFTVDGKEYVVAVAGGVASADHVFTAAGSFPVRAEFTPVDAGRFSGSSDETTVMIEARPDVPEPGTPDPGLSFLGSLGENALMTEMLTTVVLGSLADLATR